MSSDHRVEMCRLLTSTSDWLSVSTWESENPKWTPTVLSVEYHAEKAKSEFDAGLRLLGTILGFFLTNFGSNFIFSRRWFSRIILCSRSMGRWRCRTDSENWNNCNFKEWHWLHCRIGWPSSFEESQRKYFTDKRWNSKQYFFNHYQVKILLWNSRPIWYFLKRSWLSEARKISNVRFYFWGFLLVHQWEVVAHVILYNISYILGLIRRVKSVYLNWNRNCYYCKGK